MKKRKGLTLLEIVISMALIGMIAIVFLTIFGTGNSNIFRAGDRTDNTFELQEAIDQQIKKSSITDIDKTKFNITLIDTKEEKIKSPITVNIEHSGKKVVEIIDGKYITIESKNKKLQGLSITTFVPNQ